MSERNVKITTLPSGLRVVSDLMSQVETVSVGVWVNVGSRNETRENNGISHFLEHMAFKGTDSRSAKDIAEQFDNIGGRVNAFTSRENTVYYARVLKDDIDVSVDILADILQNSVFDKEEMEKERQVILQEIAMTNDTPDDIIFDYHQENAFSDQPIGRPILGSEENVKSFTRNDLQSYIDQKYSAKNIVVSAAGNVNHEKFVKLVEKYFSAVGTCEAQKAEGALYNGGDFRKEKDLEQVHLLLGFEGVSYLDDDYYKMQVLSLVLGGGMSSRLFQEIREKRGLVYSVYAYNSVNSDCGMLGIYAGTTPENGNEFLDVACEELKKVMNDGITNEELGRAVNQFKASLLMSAESTVSRSQKLSSNILSYGRVISSGEVMDRINDITIADLQKFSQKIFLSKQPTFSTIGKVKRIQSYDEICTKISL